MKGKPSKRNGAYGAIEMYHIITSDSTIKDLDRTMARLRNEVESAGEEIVGSIMASCNARGPSSGHNVPCRMMDASRFAKEFPGVPLIGFYAWRIGQCSRRRTVCIEQETPNFKDLLLCSGYSPYPSVIKI